METVARYFNVELAELAKGALESEGIPTYLHSEGQARLFGAEYLGGVTIQVPPSCVDVARDILKTVGGDDDRQIY